MMNYREQEQKKVLQLMENDILALIVINTISDEYIVLYSDEAYRQYHSKERKQDFFGKWQTVGYRLIDPRDRERMMEEICKESLLLYLERNDDFSTLCRFRMDGESYYSRIRVKKDLMEPNTLVMSIRNVDQEIRREKEWFLKEKQQKNEMDQMEDTLKQMRLKNFISQMHPHFLYNALSSIREVVLMDPEYGADLLYDFTVHLRASIRAITNDDLISFNIHYRKHLIHISLSFFHTRQQADGTRKRSACFVFLF